jgi:hypothetical protein
MGKCEFCGEDTHGRWCPECLKKMEICGDCPHIQDDVVCDCPEFVAG